MWSDQAGWDQDRAGDSQGRLLKGGDAGQGPSAGADEAAMERECSWKREQLGWFPSTDTLYSQLDITRG